MPSRGSSARSRRPYCSASGATAASKSPASGPSSLGTSTVSSSSARASSAAASAATRARSATSPPSGAPLAKRSRTAPRLSSAPTPSSCSRGVRRQASHSLRPSCSRPWGSTTAPSMPAAASSASAPSSTSARACAASRRCFVLPLSRTPTSAPSGFPGTGRGTSMEQPVASISLLAPRPLPSRPSATVRGTFTTQGTIGCGSRSCCCCRPSPSCLSSAASALHRMSFGSALAPSWMPHAGGLASRCAPKRSVGLTRCGRHPACPQVLQGPLRGALGFHEPRCAPGAAAPTPAPPPNSSALAPASPGNHRARTSSAVSMGPPYGTCQLPAGGCNVRSPL
mmetsp:Transcript_2879/g.8923  ORF Transcript_2879/g.8923 Transcript_2879/m.8923 type:complete len:339 (+) Transcript_2879:834-1850(+)